MKNRVFYFGVAFFSVIVFVIGMFGKKSYINCGIGDVVSVLDLENVEIRQAGMIGYSPQNSDEVEERTYNSFLEHEAEYVEDTLSAPIIVKVIPTGRISIASDSIGQEVQILEVIKGGENIISGDQCYIYYFGALSTRSGQVCSEMSCNIMYEEWEYYLFLEPSDLNEYQDEKIYWYYSLPFLSCIRVGGPDTREISVDELSRNYSEFKELAFFAVSDRIVSVIENIRKILLDSI